MPTQPTDTRARLNTLTTCFTITVETLEILANTLQTDFLEAIANTTRSLLKNLEVNCFLSLPKLNLTPLPQTAKRHKRTCIELMEQTHQLLDTILILHINSDTGGVLSPSLLNYIGEFTV
jgi:hypothetical protein